mmetsp:Transcript_7391/g.15831  ORF Transcript_7391/g.15831 Transcript_7391/m.15831 type:complete len:360 (-) Transcript_7391:581-1660(-)
MGTHFRLLQERLSIVFLQHLDCHLHSLNPLLIIISCGFVVLVLISPNLIHLLLRRRDTAKFSLQRRNVISQTGDRSICFVNLACERVHIFLVLRLFLFSFSHLLVTESLLRPFLLCLVEQLLDHTLNEPLHLGKDVLPSTSGSSAGRLRCQQTDLHAVLLSAEGPQHLHNTHNALGIILSVSGQLKEKTIRTCISTARFLLDDLLCSSQSFELLTPALDAGLMVCGSLHAVHLQRLQGSRVGCLILFGSGKITLRCGQALAVCCLGLLGVCQLFVLLLTTLGEGSLHHLIIELGFGLSLRRGTALILSLRQHILQNRHNCLQSTVAQPLRILLLRLQERLDALSIMSGKHSTVDQRRQR